MMFVMELSFLLLLIYTSLPSCWAWITEYKYQPQFTTNFLNFLDDSISYPKPTLSSFDFGYQSLSLQHTNSLLYKKIFENQLYAYSLISELESNLPCELRSTKGPFCSSVVPKEIYFADYPHVKALANLQWKRLRNALYGHKLGSLRVNSPFYRP